MRIDFQKVSVTRGGKHLLAELDLSLEERRIGIIGANGSGKTTLARLCNGLVLPDTGRVLAAGLDTREEVAEVRRRVGMVFQFPEAQIIQPIVIEDVAFGLQLRGLSARQARAEAEAQLRRLDLLELAERPAHSLSGGRSEEHTSELQSRGHLVCR